MSRRLLAVSAVAAIAGVGFAFAGIWTAHGTKAFDLPDKCGASAVVLIFIAVLTAALGEALS